MIVYLAGPPEDGDEYVEAKTKLETKGHEVICNPTADAELSTSLSDLLHCDALCLMELWWSDLQATQISNVASWLGITFVDTHGEKVATGSLRSMR